MTDMRLFDLRVTVAWVAGIGLSLWAYYGQEDMEIPRRVLHRMLRANFDYPFVKFGMTEDDRPMLVTELPASALTRDELARALVRLTVVADRLLDETASAVADRAVLPDWSERQPHIGGALGCAILQAALKQEWFVQNLDSRALTLTALGRRQIQARFGLEL